MAVYRQFQFWEKGPGTMTSRIAVDLYSDTVTKPTAEMFRFMGDVEVGDEQKGEDPTVNLLQEMVAELLGKEAAVYLPSGTMCNEISFAVLCRPGDEIIMDRTAHPLHFEVGAPSAISHAQIRGLDGVRGIFTAAQVEEAIRPLNRHSPRSRVVAVEQITNVGGGAIWSLAEIESVCTAAHAHGLAAHLDGARLLNAVVATGTSAADFAAPFDVAWIDLTKGLGAPVGAVLAGSQEFIEEAWLWKHRLGGAMRQAGVIAAAGVYALRHHVERLADDHSNARVLAEGLAQLPGIAIDPGCVEANIMLFDVAETGMTAAEFTERMLREHAIRFSVFGPTTVRAVTHLDVSRDDVDVVLTAVADLLRAAPIPN
jgi:threonine aldolase